MTDKSEPSLGHLCPERLLEKLEAAKPGTRLDEDGGRSFRCLLCSQEVVHISFWCVLIRNAVLKEVPFLDEKYIHYASDFAYCDAARKSGWTCLIDHDIKLVHLGQQSWPQTPVGWRGRDLGLYLQTPEGRDTWK